jgi:hypothetical protein
MKILRMLLGIPSPIVGRADALRLAEDYARENELLIVDPVIVEELKTWLVWLRGDIKGGPWVKFDNQKGEVIAYDSPAR